MVFVPCPVGMNLHVPSTFNAPADCHCPRWAPLQLHHGDVFEFVFLHRANLTTPTNLPAGLLSRSAVERRFANPCDDFGAPRLLYPPHARLVSRAMSCASLSVLASLRQFKLSS